MRDRKRSLNWSRSATMAHRPTRWPAAAAISIVPELMRDRCTVNGKAHSVDVDGDTALLWVLRDVLGMTGTKFGCGMALCGACTVHIDGVATRSCITPIESIGNSS